MQYESGVQLEGLKMQFLGSSRGFTYIHVNGIIRGKLLEGWPYLGF